MPNLAPIIPTELATRLYVLQVQMQREGGVQCRYRDWIGELREIELALRGIPVRDCCTFHRTGGRNDLSCGGDDGKAAEATPNATGTGGDLYPAASWCSGPHPDDNACSACVGAMESHIAMKAAGLL